MRISSPSGVLITPGLGRLARRCAAAALVIVSFAVVAGCDVGGTSAPPDTPKSGGTLFVNVQGGLDILDPQRTYSATEMNVLRLTTRTLTTYKSIPGTAASEIVGDLATDTGRPSEGNRVWDFTLKPNVRWQDGSLVTCSQVKYGIERRFSDLADMHMEDGAPYPQSYLQDNVVPYRGPWYGDDNNGKGLESIKCVDEKNIRFNLKIAVGDFGYTLALTTFAPVPPKQDTKQGYAKNPYSNGPYKLEAPLNGTGLVLVRNNFWLPSTDQVRKAYPDKIVFDFHADDLGIVTNQMIEDQGDTRNMLMLDGNVAPNFQQQVVNDPDLMARTFAGPNNAVRYMAINTRRVQNVACRQALIYAFNKRKWRAVLGGSVAGDYATTMILPDLKAHKDFDLFDSLANPEGNPDKAISIMEDQAKAKKPCRATIKVAFRNVPPFPRVMSTVVEAYQLAGIQVVLAPLDPATYYTAIGDPTNDFDMMVSGWIPDWANGSAIIPPLFSVSGGADFSLLDDPKINQQMDAALAETVPERQWALWGDLDQQIQQLAVTIPILYEKAIGLAGSNVRGAFIHPAFGEPDLCVLGLAQP